MLLVVDYSIFLAAPVKSLFVSASSFSRTRCYVLWYTGIWILWPLKVPLWKSSVASSCTLVLSVSSIFFEHSSSFSYIFLLSRCPPISAYNKMEYTTEASTYLFLFDGLPLFGISLFSLRLFPLFRLFFLYARTFSYYG